MDLVHDDVPDGFQVLAERLAHEDRLERLGRRDQQVRRVEGLLSPLALGGVAVADADGQAELTAPPLHPGQDVAVEGPERRDVDRREPAALPVQEPVEDREHGRLGLARARGRDQQEVVPRDHLGHGELLGLGEPLEAAVRDRLADAGVEQVEGAHASAPGGSSASIGPRRVPSASSTSTVSLTRQRETGLKGSATIFRTSYPASLVERGDEEDPRRRRRRREVQAGVVDLAHDVCGGAEGAADLVLDRGHRVVVADEHELPREAGPGERVAVEVAHPVDHDAGPLGELVRAEEALDSGIVVPRHDQDRHARPESREHLGDLAPLLSGGERHGLLDVAEEEEPVGLRPGDQAGQPLDPVGRPARDVPPVAGQVGLDPEVKVGHDERPLPVLDHDSRALGQELKSHARRISPRRGM